MAIVGTAFVRLRVIGDKLAADIGKQVQASVEKAGPQLDSAGASIGEKVGEKVGDGVRESAGAQLDKVADDIGNAIGERMAQNLGKSLKRRAGDAMAKGLESTRASVSKAGNALQPIFDKIGQRWGSRSSGGFRKTLMQGIAGAIGVMFTMLPSVLAWGGAVAGAVAASVIPAITAIGPAAAGAGLAAVAAFSAIKISAGLVGLAMKTPSAALEDFQKRAEEFRASIGRPVQAGLIPHLNASMRLLRPLIASIQPQLTELGLTLGDVASDFAEAVGQGVMMERIGRILTTNNTFVRDAGAGVGALGQAFIVLLDHLSPVTTAIGEMVGQFGAWALATINAASASGQLDAWITKMWDSFLRLSGIIVDFGIGIYNVFSASKPAADGMLTTLENTGRKFREWTEDTGNQERMTRFFTNMRRISSEVYGILRDIAAVGLGGLENTNVDSVIQGLETLKSFGEPLTRMFRDIQEAAGPDLADAFSSLADIVHELAESGVIGIVAGAFANLTSAIAGLLALPGVGTFLSFVAGLAVLGKTISFLMTIFSVLLTALRPVLGIFRIIGWAVGILVGAFGIIPVAIAAVVAGLIYFFAFTETGRAIISAVWEGIKAAIGAAVDGIIAAWNWMVQAFSTAVDWVVNLAQTIWSAISGAFTAVVDTVVSVFTTVRDFIIGVWTAIWGFIQPILQGIWDFITSVFDGIRSVIETAINIIYEIWIRIWPLLALPIRILYGVAILIFTAIWDFIKFVFQAISDFVIMIWNGIVAGITWALDLIWTGITTAWNAVYNFVSGILATIRDFILMIWDGIVGGVTWALDRLWTGIQNIWNAVWGFIQPILNRIGGFISGVWGGIVDGVMWFMDRLWRGIQNIWNNITGFIQTAMDVIGGIISGVWDFLGGVGQGVLDGLKAAVNVVIGAINTVISGINWAIGTANELPGPDIPTIPKIPRLAKGGVISPTGGGTLAMIAEAGRKERVEPLDPSGLSRRDRALINQLAGGGATNVTVYIGERELTEIVDVVVEDRESGLADRVLTGTKG